MKRKNILWALLVCAAMIGSFIAPADASDTCMEYLWLEDLESEWVDLSDLTNWEGAVSLRASKSIDGDIPALALCPIIQSVSLQANDLITFNCSYSPLSTRMDFGVIAPNGRFYYVNVKEGSINQAIGISQSGSYTVAIRNNSSQTVRVVGFVNY